MFMEGSIIVAAGIKWVTNFDGAMFERASQTSPDLELPCQFAEQNRMEYGGMRNENRKLEQW